MQDVVYMKVLIITEWTNPKEPERNKTRYKLGDEMRPYRDKLVQEKGIKARFQGWSLNNGQMLNTAEFETFEDFEKMMTDQEWRRYLSKYSYLCDNARTRIMFESFQMPPET